MWAQDSTAQQGAAGGDWSWLKTRQFFHDSLTATDPATRDELFSKALVGLGHQIHLLQDMAVPAHVRNDAHPLPYNTSGTPHIEIWAARNKELIKDIALATTITTDVALNQITVADGMVLAPTARLSDDDQYDGSNPSTSVSIGLAEYTNANFFSDDTIFSEISGSADPHAFPFPGIASTDLQSYIDGGKLPTTIVAEDGVEDVGFWIEKNADGETISHFVKPSYFSYDMSPESHAAIYYRLFYLDEACHQDYAAKLIPRAIGYSAALLDYFFRGTIAIGPPDAYVYAVIDGSTDQSFQTINAKLHNTTSDEAMLDGTLVAVARYKRRVDDVPDLSANEPPVAASRQEEYTYSVSLPVAIASLGSDPAAAEEFSFDFSAHPIPAGITDLFLQVVFSGTLGSEVDTAIAIGAVDLAEPNHIATWNLTDRFYLQGALLTAEEIRADAQLLDYLEATCAHLLTYLDPLAMDIRLGFSASTAIAPQQFIVDYASLQPGRYGRIMVLSGQPSLAMHANRRSSAPALDQTSRLTLTAVTNQEVGAGFTNTAVTTFREITTHNFSGYLFYCPSLSGLGIGDWPAAADDQPVAATISFP